MRSNCPMTLQRDKVTAPSIYPERFRAQRVHLSRRVAPTGRWSFAVFILLNADYFLRPTEVLGVKGWNVYQWLMIACGIMVAPALVSELSFKALAKSPITAFVVAILVLIGLSLLPSVDASAAAAGEFAKVLVYFALIVAMLNTPQRLQSFLIWLAVLIAAVGMLPLLNYYHFLTIPTLNPITDTAWNPVSKTDVPFLRLVGPGVFHDPNDLCDVLSVGALLCVYARGLRRDFVWRLMWLGMLATTIYAMVLTQSRGGLIAVAAGIMALFFNRFGWRKGLVLSVILLSFFLVQQNRQTDISASSGTGQVRVQLWSSALVLFQSRPLLGVGAGRLAGLIGRVAHNSFLQCYAELGWFGGTAFLGAFATVIYWLRPSALDPIYRETNRLRAYLFAVVVAYVAGMLSLSHTYEVMPYLVLGLGVAFHRIASPDECEVGWLRGRYLFQLSALSIAFLVAIHVFVRLTLQS
jgi:putative inorganic carbon (HCO3(-)) transporter